MSRKPKKTRLYLYHVKVISSQYIEVELPEGASDAEIKDAAQDEARYEGSLYDVEIISSREVKP